MFAVIAPCNQKANQNFDVLKLPTLPVRDTATFT